MRNLHDAVSWRSLAIVLPLWALTAPGVCAALCGWSHCDGPAGRLESHAQQDLPSPEDAEPCASGQGMDWDATSGGSAEQAASCRCDEVAARLPEAVDTGSAISLDVTVVALPALSAPVPHLPRAVFDLAVHPFPGTNPPLLI